MSDESMTRMELARRSGNGVDITLVWVQGGTYFEIPAEPYLAQHVYHHPFAYRDFSRVDVEDVRLVA